MHPHTILFMCLTFGFFFIGVALNLWQRASHMVNSSLNGISTYRAYFKYYGAQQAVKIFIALCFLVWAIFHESSLQSIIFGLWPSMPDWLKQFVAINPPTAGAIGIVFDIIENVALTLLKKRFSWLDPEIPPADQTPVSK